MSTQRPALDGPINQWRRSPDGAWVQRYNIIGSDLVCYDAWYVCNRPADYSSRTTGPDGRELGMVGTERLPPSLDALPANSPERLAQVSAWLEDRYDEARALIRRAFPDAERATGADGRLSRTVKGAALQARYENWRNHPDWPGAHSHYPQPCHVYVVTAPGEARELFATCYDEPFMAYNYAKHIYASRAMARVDFYAPGDSAGRPTWTSDPEYFK